MEPQQWTWVVRASSSIIQQIPQPPSVKENKRGYCSARARFSCSQTPVVCIYLFWHFTPHTKGKFGPREREEQICWRPELKEWVIRRKKIKSSLRFLPGEITHFVWPSAATALIHLMSAAPQEVILLLEHTHAGRDPRHKASPFDMPPSPTTADLIFSWCRLTLFIHFCLIFLYFAYRRDEKISLPYLGFAGWSRETIFFVTGGSVFFANYNSCYILWDHQRKSYQFQQVKNILNPALLPAVIGDTFHCTAAAAF